MKKTLFGGLEGSDYYSHRTIWIHKSDQEAKDDTVEKYITGLRRDAMIRDSKKIDTGMYGSTRVESEQPYSTSVTPKRKASREKDTYSKRYRTPESRSPNVNKYGKSNDNYKNNYDKNRNYHDKPNPSPPSKTFPHRRKDEHNIAREKKKDIFTSSKSSLKCDYCGKTGHIYDECFKRKREETEKGKSLVTVNDDSDEEISYKYDDEERILCLSLRDNFINVPLPASVAEDNSSIAIPPINTVETSPVERCLMARTKQSTPGKAFLTK
jgi:hypothetical protein